MKTIQISQILPLIEGTIIQGPDNVTIHNVMRKSKKLIDDNTLLFHLDRKEIRGKYYKDNHSIAIVSDRPEKCEGLGKTITLIKVKNIKTAFWTFIDYYRNQFQIPVFGITGTCGKTTTKEMLKHILRKEYEVVATYRNMNSNSMNLEYLTDIDEQTEVAIFEMPVASHDYLTISCRYFKPTIRILLNIGVYHLTDCDTPDEYLQSKAKILDGFDPASHTLIINADDENIKKIDLSPAQNNILTFGCSEGCNFKAEDITYANNGMNFTMKVEEKAYPVYVPGYGEHNVYNALAALAGLWKLGYPLEKGIKRLATFKHIKEHLEFREGINGCTVIDDTWNSSPPSMESALNVLNKVAGSRTKVAILGTMPRLGEGIYADEQYAKMGEAAIKHKTDVLIVVGEEAKEIGRKALELGMDSSRVFFTDDGTELMKLLAPYLNENSIILLKVTYRVMVTPSFAKMKSDLIINENG